MPKSKRVKSSTIQQQQQQEQEQEREHKQQEQQIGQLQSSSIAYHAAPGLFSQQQPQVSSISNRQIVWYSLMESASGQPFMGMSTEKINIEPSADVTDFRKCVHSEKHKMLNGIDSSQLLVYKDMQSFEKRMSEVDKELPLKSSFRLQNMGKSEENAIIVAVPHIETVKVGRYVSILCFQDLILFHRCND